MLKLFCLAFVLCILMADLGLVKSTGPTRDDNSLVRVKQIINGQIADKHINTVFGFVSSAGDGCTGTFIAPNMILTAASCSETFVASSPIKIYNKMRNVMATISALHASPLYVSDKKNPVENIAVIQLASNVDSIRVASLGFNYAISCNETVYQYGFGRTDPFKIGMSEQLKVFAARVVQCSWFTYYNHYIPFVPFKYELQTEGLDGCALAGDGGGPLFTKDDLLIAVHNSITRIDKNYGFSARILKHKKFLKSVLSKN